MEAWPGDHFDWVNPLGDDIDAHVLIVGEGTLDLMCTLIRRGCPGVSAVRFSERVPTEPVGVVLVPSVTNMVDAARAVDFAIHALVPDGRIFLRAPHHLVDQIEHLLGRQGFSMAERMENEGLPVLRALLPLADVGSWPKGVMNHV
jgi:hypothetical protein